MNTKSHSAISNICSAQTVAALLLSYLIILLYIIPTAQAEALEVAGLDGKFIPCLKYSRLGILSQYSHLNTEFRSLFISTELTAGVIEDIILASLVLAFLYNLNPGRHGTKLEGVPGAGLVLTAFILDVMQTCLSVCFMGVFLDKRLILYLILFLAAAKSLLLAYIIIKAFLSWRNRRPVPMH